jgi:hypothetical protein
MQDTQEFVWIEVAHCGAFLLVALALPLSNKRADVDEQ